MPPRVAFASRPLVALVVATLALAGKPQGPVIFDPDPAAPGAGKLEGETWGKIGPTAAIRLTRIDDATRTNYIRHKTGLETDPFGTSPEHAEGYLSFHILIENLGEQRVVFEPEACRLVTSWKDSFGPIDYPTIYTAYGINDRTPPAGLDKIRGAILDGEVVLGPGEKKDGLMIYRAVDPTIKRFQVDVRATLTDGSALAFSACFKKRKA